MTLQRTATAETEKEHENGSTTENGNLRLMITASLVVGCWYAAATRSLCWGKGRACIEHRPVQPDSTGPASRTRVCQSGECAQRLEKRRMHLEEVAFSPRFVCAACFLQARTACFPARSASCTQFTRSPTHVVHPYRMPSNTYHNSKLVKGERGGVCHQDMSL